MELKRGVDADVLTALEEPAFPILMVHLDWPDAPAWAHTGVGVIEWDGNDWLGVGPVGGISIPAEAVGGVVSAEAVLSLVGVPADLDGMSDDAIRGRSVDVYIAFVEGRPGGASGAETAGPGNTLIGDPVALFSGTMGGLDLDAKDTGSGVEHTAAVPVDTGPSARSMATVYHSDEDQKRQHPTDTAGRLVIMAMANAEKLRWPEN